uniref:guanylate cyclase n=1 Tax=Placozoa sp. H4 TaxID=1034858 RepID=A0A7G7LKB8_9METZ|nr:NIT domain GCY 4 [Placozoa sp. H4]
MKGVIKFPSDASLPKKLWNSSLCCGDNPVTTRGRRLQILKMLLLVCIPCIVLIVQASFSFSTELTRKYSTQTIRKNINFSLTYASLVDRLQYEVGLTIYYIGSNYSDPIYQQLRMARLSTDIEVNEIAWPKNVTINGYTSHSEFLIQLKLKRQRVDNQSSSMNDQIEFYSKSNEIFLTWLSTTVQNANNSNLWKILVGYQMLSYGKEEKSLERASGILYYFRGYLNASEHLYFIEKTSKGRTYLNISKQYSQTIRQRFNTTDEINDLQTQQQLILFNEKITIIDDSKASLWFFNMSNYINALYIIQAQVGHQIINDATIINQAADVDLALSAFLLVVVLFTCPILVYLISRLTTNMQLFAKQLADKTGELEYERKRTDDLLHQMLPPPVVKRLKQGKPVLAETFEDATIFFSDIVGFTYICHSSSALEVVDMLNLLYGVFDAKIETFDVYKIETIGDAYMVVSGVPKRLENRLHAKEIADMALELLKAVKDMRVPHMKNFKIHLRAGIHTGPCAAGVVGCKMPRYCLFGDTVNTASRMESNGQGAFNQSNKLASRIHVSKAAYDALQHIGGYETKSRGYLNIKGLGEMETFWLLGKLGAS